MMKSSVTVSCKTFVFIILLAFVANCPNGLSQESRLLVLQGATVIDGRGGNPISEAVIQIEGDRIQSVGAKGTNVPAGATVVDLSGKFIIPGLIESHAHYGEWMGEVFLNHGVTSVLAVGEGSARKKKHPTRTRPGRRGFMIRPATRACPLPLRKSRSATQFNNG